MRGQQRPGGPTPAKFSRSRATSAPASLHTPPLPLLPAAVHADDPEFKDFEDISQLPQHRLAEIRR